MRRGEIGGAKTFNKSISLRRENILLLFSPHIGTRVRRSTIKSGNVFNFYCGHRTSSFFLKEHYYININKKICQEQKLKLKKKKTSDRNRLDKKEKIL